ncbi:MAG: hypothetical protein Q8N51_11160, partial [Gammaproteobacteria bacterium]|nr:hypothetical protein [Gammaproteobacteria bacterium]
MKEMRAFSISLMIGCLAATGAWADEPPTREALQRVAGPQFSPYAGRNFPTRVLWGDTHLHT